MRTYSVVKRFFVADLNRYIPQWALIGEYENASKLVLWDAPVPLTPTIELDGLTYLKPEEIGWLSLLRVNTAVFSEFMTPSVVVPEDQYGNLLIVGGDGDGLVVRNGVPYLLNADTAMYNAVRTAGADGSVGLEVNQTGVNL